MTAAAPGGRSVPGALLCYFQSPYCGSKAMLLKR